MRVRIPSDPPKFNTMKNNQRVIIHSFGDGIEHTGTIKGISWQVADEIVGYIVQLDKPDPWKSEWDCITVPNSCLRAI